MSKPIEIKKKIDLTASTIFNSKSELASTPVNKIYKWVDDNITDKCNLCKTDFSLFTRKHHCRCCGRIFCYKCSGYNIIVPKDFSLLHKKENDTVANRVCQNCHENIIRFNDVNRHMKLFDILELDLDILYSMRNVCRIWREYADFRINKLRELQYSLPNHIFTNLEKKLLWMNYGHVINHPKYLIQLLKSIDYKGYKERESKLKLIIELMKNNREQQNKSISCRKMMCTRNCKKYNFMTCEDALNLLTENISSVEIRHFAILCFVDISINELISYLPFLIYNMRFESIENSVIGKFLINKCKSIQDIEQLSLSNEFFWELNMQLDQTQNSQIKNIYSYFLENLLAEIPSVIKNRLLDSQSFVKFMNNLRNEKDEKIINHNLANIKPKDIVIPLHPEFECFSIDMNGIHIKSSNSQPIILPLTCYLKNDPEKKLFKYTILYKFEDVRKDQTIISMIKIIKLILKQEEDLHLDIVTYKTRPTGCNHGFIEIVPNSHTIRFIKENLKFSILNYIIEHNKNKTVDNLRQKFLKSCAVYCVITYIFGIGDRHLDNIMLTQNGTLFHIDYGYIMGHDPKPLTTPTMRIPHDMVDALGGDNSQYFRDFKKLCNIMYSCVRRHVNLFINMFSVLTKTEPPLLSSDDYVYDELIKRMVPGENAKISEIQLYNIIDNSSKSIHHNVIDMFHFYNKTYLTSILSSSLSYVKSWNPFSSSSSGGSNSK